jgi:hypothetical protein
VNCPGLSVFSAGGLLGIIEMLPPALEELFQHISGTIAFFSDFAFSMAFQFCWLFRLPQRSSEFRYSFGWTRYKSFCSRI